MKKSSIIASDIVKEMRKEQYYKKQAKRMKEYNEKGVVDEKKHIEDRNK